MRRDMQQGSWRNAEKMKEEKKGEENTRCRSARCDETLLLLLQRKRRRRGCIEQHACAQHIQQQWLQCFPDCSSAATASHGGCEPCTVSYLLNFIRDLFHLQSAACAFSSPSASAAAVPLLPSVLPLALSCSCHYPHRRMKT